MNVYDFSVYDREGKEHSLKEYQGKVLLIVNTATECGFTPTYADLQTLYTKNKDKGLEILDFPCDQFGHQAPGSDQEIHTFCTSRFGVTFPQFHKIEVNGPSADPLYCYLKEQCGFAGFDPQHKLTPVLEELLDKQDPHWRESSDIKWNFTKFLVDRNGNVVERFEPTTDIMTTIQTAIDNVL